MSTNAQSNNGSTCCRHFFYGIVNLALLLAGLSNLGVGTWSALQGNAAIAATSLTAGLVLLFAATIDRFESLKGLGIEAKTRQIDQKIAQADEALTKLRKMTELTGAALIELNCSMGRWGSAPRPRKLISFASHIKELMKDVGSDERTVENTMKPWALTLCQDMAFSQAAKLRELLRNKLNALNIELKKLHTSLQSDHPDIPTLQAKINSIEQFQDSQLKNIGSFKLEDFPDKLMEIYENVPVIDPKTVKQLRDEAEKYVPGMQSLRLNQTLADSELWIKKLNESRKP